MADDQEPKIEDFKWPWERKLRKPVLVDGDEVSFLSLREPTTEDMVKFGVLDGTFGSGDGDTVIRMIAHLGKTTPVDLSRRLHPKDFFAIRNHLARFFSAAATDTEDT